MLDRYVLFGFKPFQFSDYMSSCLGFSHLTEAWVTCSMIGLWGGVGWGGGVVFLSVQILQSLAFSLVSFNYFVFMDIGLWCVVLYNWN